MRVCIWTRTHVITHCCACCLSVYVCRRGGPEAYLRDRLESRAPESVGQCKPVLTKTVDREAVSCVRVRGNPMRPYNCTLLDSGLEVPGDMTDAIYRLQCEVRACMCEECARAQVCVCGCSCACAFSKQKPAPGIGCLGIWPALPSSAGMCPGNGGVSSTGWPKAMHGIV